MRYAIVVLLLMGCGPELSAVEDAGPTRRQAPECEVALECEAAVAEMHGQEPMSRPYMEEDGSCWDGPGRAAECVDECLTRTAISHGGWPELEACAP